MINSRGPAVEKHCSKTHHADGQCNIVAQPHKTPLYLTTLQCHKNERQRKKKARYVGFC